MYIQPNFILTRDRPTIRLIRQTYDQYLINLIVVLYPIQSKNQPWANMKGHLLFECLRILRGGHNHGAQESHVSLSMASLYSKRKIKKPLKGHLLPLKLKTESKMEGKKKKRRGTRRKKKKKQGKLPPSLPPTLLVGFCS